MCHGTLEDRELIIRRPSSVIRPPNGGARRDRTDDLLLAKQALSQLSYGPFRDQRPAIRDQIATELAYALITDF